MITFQQALAIESRPERNEALTELCRSFIIKHLSELQIAKDALEVSMQTAKSLHLTTRIKAVEDGKRWLRRISQLVKMAKKRAYDNHEVCSFFDADMDKPPISEAYADQKIFDIIARVKRANTELQPELNKGFLNKETRQELQKVIESSPIRKVVEPLKVDAIRRAEEEATKMVADVEKNLRENGWDLNIVAPHPDRSIGYGSMMRELMIGKRQFVSSITEPESSYHYSRTEPYIVKMKPWAVEQYIQQQKDTAELQYELFINKLISKVGPVDSAELKGNHVWDYSLLTVTLADGTKEQWKTTQIYNHSKYGKLFPQWPTRKLKTRIK